MNTGTWYSTVCWAWTSRVCNNSIITVLLYIADDLTKRFMQVVREGNFARRCSDAIFFSFLSFGSSVFLRRTVFETF